MNEYSFTGLSNKIFAQAMQAILSDLDLKILPRIPTAGICRDKEPHSIVVNLANDETAAIFG